MQGFHGWSTIAWLIASVPIMIFFPTSVIPVFISVYAVVTGHWASWQASRIEAKQESDADVQDVIFVLTKLDKKFADLYNR